MYPSWQTLYQYRIRYCPAINPRDQEESKDWETGPIDTAVIIIRAADPRNAQIMNIRVDISPYR